MSIYWSLQRISTRVGELDLAHPGIFLGESECSMFQQFKVPKRLSEWLGGRMAIKDLVRHVDARFQNFPPRQVEVLNEASGAPYLSICGFTGKTGSISLSHSNDWVVCAYSPSGIPLGVDLERIELRSKEFVEDFFTADETCHVLDAVEGERPLMTTLIWSAKEAVLKALSSGLRVDTRSIEVQYHPGERLPGGWRRLEVNSSSHPVKSLSLVWRKETEFVLTACIPREFEAQLNRVEP